MIAMLYLCIIIIPKRPKKGLKTIITQDMSEIEKENFVEYLNYERERRKELREKAARQIAEEELEKGEYSIEKDVAEYIRKMEASADTEKNQNEQ